MGLEVVFGILGIVIGGFATLAGQFYTGRSAYKSKSEEIAFQSQVAQLQIKQQISLMLIGKRLEAYPRLYQALSDFVKETNTLMPFRGDQITKSEIENFLDKIKSFDSEISLLFSPQAGEDMRHLQSLLIDLLVDGGHAAPESLRKVGGKARDLEKALRSDLGVYGVRFSEDMTKYLPEDHTKLVW